MEWPRGILLKVLTNIPDRLVIDHSPAPEVWDGELSVRADSGQQVERQAALAAASEAGAVCTCLMTVFLFLEVKL
jgi:hypothetical protein